MRSNQPTFRYGLTGEEVISGRIDIDECSRDKSGAPEILATDSDELIDTRDRYLVRWIGAKHFERDSDQIDSSGWQHEVRKRRQKIIEFREISNKRALGRIEERACSSGGHQRHEFGFEDLRGVGPLFFGLSDAVFESLFERRVTVVAGEEDADSADQPPVLEQRNAAGQRGATGRS